MERSWVIHSQKSGTFLLTESEAIANAMEQQAAGVKPHYVNVYKDRGEEKRLPAGWLVWSTWEDGCGVVYPRKCDGKLVVATGWQGDFVMEV